MLRELIERRRIETGYTIAGLARVAAVDRSDLSKFLSGNKDEMKSESINRLLAVLGFKSANWKRVKVPA